MSCGARELRSQGLCRAHATTCVSQFCANDPEVFVQAALLAQDYCDAIDLNLGCPQMIAKRGGFSRRSLCRALPWGGGSKALNHRGPSYRPGCGHDQGRACTPLLVASLSCLCSSLE